MDLPTRDILTTNTVRASTLIAVADAFPEPWNDIIRGVGIILTAIFARYAMKKGGATRAT